jgi:hypothetical protein
MLEKAEAIRAAVKPRFATVVRKGRGNLGGLPPMAVKVEGQIMWRKDLPRKMG